ncbi:hypothetical protein [Streptomyces sp. SM11]|uniref:hypothetical protein n=1 Tax=Streptomyces sp. SM11 TaxID=565557 RepID=UPI0011B086C9|nr:hypothetical protein [Streptomyces sp. SM11]
MRGTGRRERERELEAEVTAFGELLAEHSFAPGDPGTPSKAVDDWARALDAYDAASRALHRRKQVKVVPQLLQQGMDALVDLEARVAGEPLPQRLPPCFFDSRHGQATTEARWAPSGGAKRLIAVCAADGVRLREDSPHLFSGHPASADEVDSLPLRPAGDLPLPWAIGLLALLFGYAAALAAAGDGPGAVVALIAAGAFGAVAALSGLLVASAAVDLWALVRRGHRAQATFARSTVSPHGARQHVYVVTDASGRQRECTRAAGGGTGKPVPIRSVWYLPRTDGAGKAVSSWSPVWLPLRILVGLPVLLSSAAVTLYLIPGRLIIALLS